jgi:hydrogenase maturation factor
MCIAAPGKVIKIQDKTAFVQYPGKIINKAIIGNEKVKIDSYVLVQMGIIIGVLSKNEAILRLKAF